MLERAGVIDKIGRAMIFEGIEDALLAFEIGSLGSNQE
jgi:hypothetical protein